MKYTKDGKIYSLPIVIEVESNVNGVVTKVKRYTTDKVLIEAAGYTEYVEPKLPLESLIAQSDSQINAITDMKILTEFEYKGERFYLTTENQINFGNMYIIKDSLNYPVTVKTQTGFMELKDIAEVSDFYIQAVAFVKKCIEDGWNEKAESAKKITEDYNNEMDNNNINNT